VGGPGLAFEQTRLLAASEVRKERGFGLYPRTSFNAPFPCGVKINAGNGRKNIEVIFRVAPKAKEAVAVREIFRADAFERCAKLGKRGIGRLRVFGSGFMKRSMSFVKRGCE
jgi:hypothetical protein